MRNVDSLSLPVFSLACSMSLLPLSLWLEWFFNAHLGAAILFFCCADPPGIRTPSSSTVCFSRSLLLSARRRCSQDPSRSYFCLPGISRSLLNFTLRCHFFSSQLNAPVLSPTYFLTLLSPAWRFCFVTYVFLHLFVTFFFINWCTCSHNYSFFLSWWSLYAKRRLSFFACFFTCLFNVITTSFSMIRMILQCAPRCCHSLLLMRRPSRD